VRELLRTSGSGVLVALIMLGGGLVLWVGVPVAWLYIGSQIQVKTDSVGAALGAMFIGVVASIIAIVMALAWLNRKHVEMREARGLDASGSTALEAVMTISAVVAVLGFGIWFFLIEGPGPSLAPR
jgi:heme/copper-type cytochrome/quinol oxidase subunit 2